MLTRYASERCGDCSRGLTWIEIAFGRFNDPVCGACLIKREQKAHLKSECDEYCPYCREGKQTQI